MKLAIVVGNPKPKSRTLTVAGAVAERITQATGAQLAVTVDLCDYADQLFKWPGSELATLADEIAHCEFVVFASPTYKAAYTGLLKAFLDRYPSQGLRGVTAVPIMTGSSAHHAMAVDTALRPLLVELGASVPTQGLYFVMSDMSSLDAVVDEWARELSVVLRAYSLSPRGASAPMPSIPVDEHTFRQVLSRLPTGVTVIAANGPGGPVGMAANSVTSVSLDPPLVLFCPAKSSTTWPQIRAAGGFCINVMAHHHEQVTRTFALTGADRFADLAYESRPAGPALADALAWVECRIVDEYEAGDHTIVVAQVTAVAAAPDDEPLVFFRGRYGSFLHAE